MVPRLEWAGDRLCRPADSKEADAFTAYSSCCSSTAALAVEAVKSVQKALPGVRVILMEDRSRPCGSREGKALSDFGVERRAGRRCPTSVRRGVCPGLLDEWAADAPGEREVVLYFAPDTMLLHADSLRAFGRGSAQFWGIEWDAKRFAHQIFALKGDLVRSLCREREGAPACREEIFSLVRRACPLAMRDVKPAGTLANGVKRWVGMQAGGWPGWEEAAAFRAVSFLGAFGPLRKNSLADSMSRLGRAVTPTN